MFRRAFEAVDEEGKGYLNCIETMLALKAINNKLTDQEEEYMYRVCIIVML